MRFPVMLPLPKPFSYNLLPDSYKLRRRIAMKSLLAVSVSTVETSDELVIHVADEYDYRYKLAQRPILLKVLDQCCQKAQGRRLIIKNIDLPDLKSLALTKVMARLQSREDELRRRRQLIGDSLDESDKEDAENINKNNASATGQEVTSKPVGGDNKTPESANDIGKDNTSGEDIDPEESKDIVSSLKKSPSAAKVRIDDFELLRVLGRGSFGKVMQVRHKGTGQIYAMKVLRKSSIMERDQVDHTKAERRILEALRHPFLMTLRYAFQTQEKLYLVLDYLQGGELFYHLKTVRRFPESVAKIYIAEIALALGHLHSLGFIYRDLKPENILLDYSGHLCLTDFGLSKDIAEGEKATTFCGTPEYLAPEIVANLGHDKAVDWWSLGILLYELTVGIPPFYDSNHHDMYIKIQRGVLRFPPFLSEGCKSLIVGLLNRSPEHRLGSKDDVRDIMNHPYYEGFDWDKLYRKEIDIPWKPQVASVDDVSNFDQTFTSEAVADSVAPTSTLSNAVGQPSFEGFTYVPQNNFLGK